MQSRAAHALAALFTPSPDQGYDWSQYDSLVANAARNGVCHHLQLADVGGAQPGDAAAAPRPRSFQVFVASAVDRYGTEGRLWSEHPDLARLPITAWQL